MIMQKKIFGFTPGADYTITQVATYWLSCDWHGSGSFSFSRPSFGLFCDTLRTFDVRII